MAKTLKFFKGTLTRYSWKAQGMMFYFHSKQGLILTIDIPLFISVSKPKCVLFDQRKYEN